MLPMSVEPTTCLPTSRGSCTVRPTRAALATYDDTIGPLSIMSAYVTPSHSAVMVQPQASALPSKHAITRSLSGCRLAIVGERTIHCIDASAGTMLALSPPCRKMPWIRSVGSMCWRRAATFM